MFKLSKNTRDITGQKFGKLTTIKPLGLDKRQQVLWLCKCECGKEHKANSTNLTKSRIKSCGCSKGKDITGQKFNMLTVIKKTGRSCNTAKNAIEWECLCECGNTTNVSSKNLRRGNTKSCGCLLKGENHPNYKHGKTKDKAYRKDRALRTQYGISLEEYNSQLNIQNRLCAICNLPPNKQFALAVDHDHQTGKIRELLCINCNMALGGFKDNIKLLQKAIQYLNKHQGLKLHEVA